MGQELTLDAKAAEAPSVCNLRVVAAEDGVSAECEFSGHVNEDYSIELFLNGVRADDSVFEAASEILSFTDSGTGTAETEKAQVEPGIYKATAIVGKNESGNLTAVSFADSSLYQVTKNDEGYAAAPYVPSESEKDPDQSPNRPEGGAKVNGPEKRDQWEVDGMSGGSCACVHNIEYDIVQEADADQDALLAGWCSICGEVLSYSHVPNSAYAAFLKDAIGTIQKTEEGEAVIETERWISFHQAVFDAIMQKPETAVIIRYRYEGKAYMAAIPAGADVSGLCGESGFCGFRYLDQIFGGKEIE